MLFIKLSSEEIRQINEENEGLLLFIDTFVPNFNEKINEIQALNNYNQSDEFNLNIYPKMPKNLINPIEDSIRYRYIIAVEFFKKASRAIAYKYFSCSYKRMNSQIKRENKDVEKILERVFEKRNILAHIYNGQYLDTHELDFDIMIENLINLRDVLRVYVAYVKSRG